MEHILNPDLRLHRIALCLAVALAPALAQAQLYKWVDEHGQTQYSDRPPPPGAKSEQLKKSGTTAPVPTPVLKAPPSAGAKALEQKKKELSAEEKQKEEEKKTKDAQIKAENCDIARTRLKTLQDGGRILKYDKVGERQYMSDEEIQKELAPAQAKVDEQCKPPS